MNTRSAFDSLLTKNHVTYALLHDEEHNELSMARLPLLVRYEFCASILANFQQALTTLYGLGGSPAQLRAAYDKGKTNLKTWRLSPARITSLQDRQKYLGDVRFQRAYMDYFSTQHTQLKGNYKSLVGSQMSDQSMPLIYGLFGGLGQAMVTLSDALEAQNSILVVQSLVLSSVDFSAAIYQVLADPRFDHPTEDPAAPGTILGQIAYDGRFSLNRSGPGFHHASAVLSNHAAKEAIVGYLHRLDMSDIDHLLENISRLSVLMLCASHRQASPAFDFYLGRLPTLVYSLRVLVREGVIPQLDWLIRGTWFLMILAYITQLRPRLNESLVYTLPVSDMEASWDALFRPIHAKPDRLKGRHADPHFLRALKSIYALALSTGTQDPLYFQAAWKLDSQWESWTGLGRAGEASLNIRL